MAEHKEVHNLIKRNDKKSVRGLIDDGSYHPDSVNEVWVVVAEKGED